MDLTLLNYHYYGHIPKKPCEKMHFEAGLRLPISNIYYARLEYYINQLMLPTIILVSKQSLIDEKQA